jgi:hypothetical protein
MAHRSVNNREFPIGAGHASDPRDTLPGFLELRDRHPRRMVHANLARAKFGREVPNWCFALASKADFTAEIGSVLAKALYLAISGSLMCLFPILRSMASSFVYWFTTVPDSRSFDTFGGYPLGSGSARASSSISSISEMRPSSVDRVESKRRPPG